MLKNFLLLILTVATLFIFTETAFRAIGYYGMDIEFQPVEYDSRLGWRLKSNYQRMWKNFEWNVIYRTNSDGFRDIEHSPENINNEYVITVFGDSQAEGWGVERDEMWQNILARKMEAKVRLYNFGVRGYDLLQEYLLMKDKMSELEPDLVIQVLDPNDWNMEQSGIMGEDKRFRPHYTIKNDGIEFLENPQQPVKNITKNKFIHVVKKLAYQSAFITYSRFVLTYSPKVQKLLIASGLRSEIPVKEGYALKTNQYETNYKEASELAYKEIANILSEYDSKMLVVYVGDDPPESLRRIVESNTFHFISVGMDRNDIWKFDNHPNPKGHIKIASKIYEYLNTRLNISVADKEVVNNLTLK